jgi:hypothetical protein
MNVDTQLVSASVELPDVMARGLVPPTPVIDAAEPLLLPGAGRQ